MRSLSLLAATSLAFAPLAASAQEVDRPVDTSELTEKLTDPEFQAQMAEAMGAMGEVLLDMPVGPLVEAAEKMAGEPVADIDPDATVRDLAGDDAERVTDEVAEKLPHMMDAMAGMAEGLQAMLPALEAMAERMKESFDRAS